jgi:hypothetical protein
MLCLQQATGLYTKPAKSSPHPLFKTYFNTILPLCLGLQSISSFQFNN